MISKRIKAILDSVGRQDRIADIGTDHGLVPAQLINKGQVGFAILTDINEKPLSRAKALLSKEGLTSRAAFRVGSGLKPIEKEEVDLVVIAGMGGEMIANIIENDRDKAKTIKKFVLQPMTQEDKLRKYLCQNEFRIIEERIVEETTSRKSRFFPVLTVVNSNSDLLSEMELNFGAHSQMVINEDYLDYLLYEINKHEKFIDNMRNSKNEKTKKRRLELERRFNFLKEYYESVKDISNYRE